MSVSHDLHSHSTASDGTLGPAELVARAAAAGVGVLALTDHDDTAGLAEAADAAERHEIGFVPGVEVSVTWNGATIHIVGLHVNPSAAALQTGLARLREYRGWRAEEIGRRLEQAGIPGAYEAARDLARGRIISRTHFAHFLVAEGRARNLREVFQRFLKRGKPGHVPGRWAELGEAVGWILDAGGTAVVAHPARYGLTRTRLRRLLREFREAGGAGLEVVSGSHSRGDSIAMARLAREFEFAASAGSDYHGPENPWIELGRLPPLPEGCDPIWARWDTVPMHAVV